MLSHGNERGRGNAKTLFAFVIDALNKRLKLIFDRPYGVFYGQTGIKLMNDNLVDAVVFL